MDLPISAAVARGSDGEVPTAEQKTEHSVEDTMKHNAKAQQVQMHTAAEVIMPHQMSVGEVASWLRVTFSGTTSFAPVLEQYIAAFADSDIDGDTLSALRKEDLSDIGIANGVHRASIVKKWAVLKAETGARNGAEA